MSTFLQLTQRASRESGTVSGDNQPSSVTNQTLRLKKIVEWVAQAWTDIQGLHTTWRWMEGEFSGSASAGTARYTAAAWNITRFGSWITRAESVTIYDPDIGVADESAMRMIGWDTWRQTYGRGEQTGAKPNEFAISPAGELCLGPIPDKTYTINGLYQKSAQTLSANTDTPECPADFHDAIVWKALMYLAEHDEGGFQAVTAQNRYADRIDALERSQLPPMRLRPCPVA